MPQLSVSFRQSWHLHQRRGQEASWRKSWCEWRARGKQIPGAPCQAVPTQALGITRQWAAGRRSPHGSRRSPVSGPHLQDSTIASRSLWSFWNKPRTPGFADTTSESVSHGLTTTLPNCTAKGCHPLCRQQHQGKAADMR